VVSDLVNLDKFANLKGIISNDNKKQHSSYTVKPVHNSHPWDLEKVAVVQRLFRVWSKTISKVIVGLVGQGILGGHC